MNRTEIETEVLEWTEQTPWREDPARFETLALALFRFQYEACEPYARFCLGRSLITAGRHVPGRASMQQILDEDGRRCTLLDDAQFWIGVSYNWQRDTANANAAFGVLLRDFTYSKSTRQVADKLPAAGPVTQ